MQMTNEVLAAIAVLRVAAENDSERLAIDRMETALTNPPRVEQIDEKHQRFNGVVFGRDKKNYYAVRQAIYREVWRYFHGEIPDGYEIHHVDGDVTHNNIENLQCMTKAEHERLHMPDKNATMMQAKRDKARRIIRCSNCGKEFETFSNWQGNDEHFCSHACQERYRYLHKTSETRTCEICGREYRAYFRTKNRHCRSCAMKLARQKQTNK